MAYILFILYLLSLAASSGALAISTHAVFKLGKREHSALCLLPLAALICALFGICHHAEFSGGYVIPWITPESLEPSSLITAVLSVLFSIITIPVISNKFFGDAIAEVQTKEKDAGGLAAAGSAEDVTDETRPASAEEQELDVFGLIKEEFSLTDRETELCAMICEGKSNPDIATELFISENTVKTHIYNLFRKTNVASRMELASLISAYYDQNPLSGK